MGFDSFDELLIELCEAAQLDDIEEVEDIFDTGLMMVSDKVVKLDYLAHLHECRMLIELGELDPGLPDFPHRLLQHNLDAILDESPLMALDATTVFAAVRLSLAGIHSGGELLDVMTSHVQEAALAWSALQTETSVSPEAGHSRPPFDNAMLLPA